jgi:hypothetical protein
VAAFERRDNATATAFDWRFTATDLDDLPRPHRRSRQPPITRPPDPHELTAPPKENEDRAGDGDCGLRPEQLSLRARYPGLDGGVDACVLDVHVAIDD